MGRIVVLEYDRYVVGLSFVERTYTFLLAHHIYQFDTMSSSEQNKGDPLRSLVRAVRTYPTSAYSSSDPSKHDADHKLLCALRRFLAENEWANMVSFL